MVDAFGHGWKGGPRLLFLAPGVALWVWKRCSTCGRWTNGHYLGIFHHIRTYHQHEAGVPQFEQAVNPNRAWMQN